jgi:hypothetical protein
MIIQKSSLNIGSITKSKNVSGNYLHMSNNPQQKTIKTKVQLKFLCFYDGKTNQNKAKNRQTYCTICLAFNISVGTFLI